MSTFTDLEKDAASVDGFVNENGLIPTRRNGPKPSYQYLVDRWNAEIAAAILEMNKSRGFRVVGTFADGFTYELFNDVGIDADGHSWIYVGAGAPNKVVAAGTVPSVGTGYEQVTFNSASASAITTDSGASVQEYIDGQQFDNIDAVKFYVNPSALIGQRIQIKEYHAGTGYGGGYWEVVTGESANGIDIVQSSVDASIQFKLSRKLINSATCLGVSSTNNGASNKLIVLHWLNNLKSNFSTLHFGHPSSEVIDIDTVQSEQVNFNISGEFPTLRTLAGSTFVFDSKGRANININGVNFRGDTDDNQTVNHPLPNDPEYSDTFRQFANFEWNQGNQTDPSTGKSNFYNVNTNMNTIRAAVHFRCSRGHIGDNISIEGYESGVVFEGCSIGSIGEEVQIRYCQSGWHTAPDRDNPALKTTLLNVGHGTTPEFCFVGAYQKDLQEAYYEQVYFSRCCIPTVSRNTKDINHNKCYLELCHNLFDLDGKFQGNEYYNNCNFTYVHETAPAILKAGKADANNINSRLEFNTPFFEINGNTLFRGQLVSDTFQIVFDKYYDFLPAYQSWLYIKDEINQSVWKDPKFTRSFGVRAGSSVTLNYISDTSGSYVEITGDGSGLDSNGAIIDLYPRELNTKTESIPIRISYEILYDDGGSGESIPIPFAPYIGSTHKSPAQNITDTDGEWLSIERSFFSGGAGQSIACSGGFTGTLKVRNFRMSLGCGFAKSYDPNPSEIVSQGLPLYGDWIYGDVVRFNNPSAVGFIGAFFNGVSWDKYGALEAN